MGALEVDHVGGNGVGELGESRLHGEHGFERREREIEPLVAGASLGHAKLAGPASQMKGAVVAALDGGRVAGVPVVVDVGAGFAVRHECSCARGE